MPEDVGASTTQPDAGPVAIVGIGCRFPGGGDGPDAFWDLISAAGDGIRPVPDSRWSLARHYDPSGQRRGRSYVKAGGFLDDWDPAAFDAAFFGISPREAAPLDPQQRLLLTVAWECFEDAGRVLDPRSQETTGVYIGGFTLDNKLTQMSPLNRENEHSQTPTSSTLAILSNRLSYTFDLRGPSLTVDTACSSALVALHHAVTAIQRGDCGCALAGGVNVMLRPEYPLIMGAGNFLAPDGRCKSFDARGDGYGRGEGAGVVMLKSLAQAEADGDRIYACVHGTGVNQDGRTNGISVPNETAQASLIDDVLARSGVSPETVHYVEAHGTGTPTGDPIECRALGRSVAGERPRAAPCQIGSVKANVGHLEAAAGIAGVIKAALVLQRNTVPPQAGLETINPAISLDALNLTIAERAQTLADPTAPCYAGVNSFGYGGTNAHAVLGKPPEPRSAPSVEDRPTARPIPIVLSAADPSALSQRAAATAASMADTDGPRIADVAWTAARRRTPLAHRLVVTAWDARDAVDGLQAATAQTPDPRVATDKASAASDTSGLLFVYTGMGPQRMNMGRQLLAREPVFYERARACDAAFADRAGWSLLGALGDTDDARPITDTRLAQPANTLLQIALTDQLADWGLRPEAVLGHSVGEIAAGYAAGALDSDTAMAVAFHRSQAQAHLAGRGTMLALGLGWSEAESLIADCGVEATVGAVNGPANVVVSGPGHALGTLARAADNQGVFQRFLGVEIPYHSPMMAEIEDALRSRLDGLAAGVASGVMYSTVTAAPLGAQALDAAYWYRNAREPVRFAEATAAACRDGFTDTLQVGPHPVLSAALRDGLRAADRAGRVVPTLARDGDESVGLVSAVGRLALAGHAPSWSRVMPVGRHTDLPRYPWQNQTHWSESALSRRDRLGTDGHPLLGDPADRPDAARRVRLNPFEHPWLADHVVDGTTLFPGAGYVEIGLALHASDGRALPYVIDDLRFEQTLPADGVFDPELDIAWQGYDGGFQVRARIGGPESAEWRTCARGRLSAATPAAPAGEDGAAPPGPGAAFAGEDLYARLAESGLHYGPAFQTIERAWRTETGVIADLCGPAAAESDPHVIHPGVLDGCFQALIVGLGDDAQADGAFVPVAIRQVRVYTRPGQRLRCHGTITRADAERLEGDIAVYAPDGALVAEVRGLVCRAVAPAAHTAPDVWQNWLYATTWTPSEPAPQAPLPARWLVVGDDPQIGRPLERAFADAGVQASVVPAAGDVSPDLLATVDAVAVSVPAADAGAGQATAATLMTVVQAVCSRAESPDLWVVTADAQGAATISPADAGHTAAAGMVRVAQAEYPGCHIGWIDVPSAPEAETFAALLREFAAAGGESERRVDGAGQLQVPRVRRLDDITPDLWAPSPVDPTTTPVGLDVDPRAGIEGLRWRTESAREPVGDEVSLRVEAVSLNFKDALKALGVLDQAAVAGTYHGDALGMEVAAEAIAVGPDVVGLAPGDRIVARPRGGFRSHLVAREAELEWQPQLPGVDAATNAGLPIVFITAYAALAEAARLQAGERVLIQAAAGGVGQAAIQVAHWLGAEVFATAGTPEKRQRLQDLGCRHVYDSRALDFAEAIRRDTDGAGVDVVLNALSGEAADKSLEALGPWGRMIELGKRDFAEGRGLPSEPFGRCLSYIAFDLDRMMAERPATFSRLFATVWQHFQVGTFHPPAPVVYGAEAVPTAFRDLAQAKLAGKAVVTFNAGHPVHARPTAADFRPVFDARGSYIVTGGVSGFGRATALWLARHGAGSVVLMSRRGGETPGIQATVDEITRLGATARVMRVDVAAPEQVDAALAALAEDAAPVRGVFHAAGVIDDATLAHQTDSRVAAVMAPKARGAVNLHRATADLQLDHFVVFSSVAALIGTVGQAGYAAANALLDGLVGARRAAGLPGLSVQWGAISQTGMVARDAHVAAHLGALGVRAMPPERALDALGFAITRDLAQVCVADIDWSRWSRAQPGVARQPRFAALAESPDTDGREALASELAPLSLGDRKEVLAFMLAEILARTLGLAPEQVDIDTPLADMGLDSLMVTEVQTALASEIGVEVGAMDLMNSTGLRAMAEALLPELGVAEAPAEDTENQPAAGRSDGAAQGPRQEVDA